MTEPESPQPSVLPPPAPPAAPPAPPPPSPGAVAGAAASAAATMLWSRLSAGERIAIVGAAIIVVIGDWIVGALLNGPGTWISTTIASAELIFFVVVRHSGRSMSWPIPYAIVLAGLAVAIAAPAVSDTLAFLRHLTDPARVGALDLLGLVAELVGAALVAWGAFTTWRANPEG
jgi:hypothetical protein